MNNDDLILDIDDLTVDYVTDEGTVHALKGLNMKLGFKKTLGLVGETGAGKTTAAMSILRLIQNPPGVTRKGSIRLGDKDIFSLSLTEMEAIRGYYASMIFQDPMTSLNPVLTVGEQIAEVIAAHENVSRQRAEKKAGEMLELLGIPKDRAGEYPHQFSGGMKQRVVIAMALACSPKLLIADEPTTALDVTIQAQVIELMKGLKESYNMSMIMITHDLGIVAEVCDEVSVIYAGRIVEHGTLEDIFERTSHPYTEGLFNSIPNINKRLELLTPIPGLMPDPMCLPEGCAFEPRCSYANDECKCVEPPARWLSSTHYVACSAYEREGFAIRRAKKHV